MKLLDKVLLGLLVLLLPIALFLTQWFLDSPNETGTNEAVPMVDVGKLESLISEAVKTSQQKESTKAEFIISVVNYATESGSLTVAGKAPYANSNIIVTPSFIPPSPSPIPVEISATASASPQSTNVVRQVEVFSVFPSSTGNFNYEYIVPSDYNNDIIELRLDQKDAVQTIRFDLLNKKQVF